MMCNSTTVGLAGSFAEEASNSPSFGPNIFFYTVEQRIDTITIPGPRSSKLDLFSTDTLRSCSASMLAFTKR
jgi:hypothetical protein